MENGIGAVSEKPILRPSRFQSSALTTVTHNSDLLTFHAGMHMHFRLSILVIALMITLAGCASTINYKVRFIDGMTKQPINGVQLKAVLGGHYFGNRMFEARNSSMASLSDSTGLTSIELESGRGLAHHLFITKGGYEAMTGETSPTYHTWHFDYRDSDSLPGGVTNNELDLRIEKGETINIPMKRLERSTQKQ